MNDNIFESIKHIDENGNEYWDARELQKILEYTEWRKFERVIEKSQIACKASNIEVLDHFVPFDKMIEIAKGAKRRVKNFKLSRYACYLIAQNADSRKVVIALAQTYFTIQTRKQELINEQIKGEGKATQTHYKMAKDIRNFIKSQDGIMPEKLPTPEKSLKELQKINNSNPIDKT